MNYYLLVWGLFAIMSLFVSNTEAGMLFLLDMAVTLWVVTTLLALFQHTSNDDTE